MRAPELLFGRTHHRVSRTRKLQSRREVNFRGAERDRTVGLLNAISGGASSPRLFNALNARTHSPNARNARIAGHRGPDEDQRQRGTHAADALACVLRGARVSGHRVTDCARNAPGMRTAKQRWPALPPGRCPGCRIHRIAAEPSWRYWFGPPGHPAQRDPPPGPGLQQETGGDK